MDEITESSLLDFVSEEFSVPEGRVIRVLKKYFPRFLYKPWVRSLRVTFWEERIYSILEKRKGRDFSSLEDARDLAIAEKISSCCFRIVPLPTDFFFLDDKMSCLILWESGDLCEVEAIMEIEDIFNIVIPESFMDVFLGMTLREFTAWVRKNSPLYDGPKQKQE